MSLKSAQQASSCSAYLQSASAPCSVLCPRRRSLAASFDVSQVVNGEFPSRCHTSLRNTLLVFVRCVLSARTIVPINEINWRRWGKLAAVCWFLRGENGVLHQRGNIHQAGIERLLFFRWRCCSDWSLRKSRTVPKFLTKAAQKLEDCRSGWHALFPPTINQKEAATWLKSVWIFAVETCWTSDLVWMHQWFLNFKKTL